MMGKVMPHAGRQGPDHEPEDRVRSTLPRQAYRQAMKAAEQHVRHRRSPLPWGGMEAGWRPSAMRDIVWLSFSDMPAALA